MSIEFSDTLSNGYSNIKLTEIVHSFKSLSSEERLLLHCYMALFIGVENENTKKSILANIKFLSEETGHKVQEILPPNRQ